MFHTNPPDVLSQLFLHGSTFLQSILASWKAVVKTFFLQSVPAVTELLNLLTLLSTCQAAGRTGVFMRNSFVK